MFPAHSTERLSDAEMDFWRMWKHAHEAVVSRVVAGITAAADLSEADFSILGRLDEGGGSVRQNHMASLLGWERSRLSKQLTRMEKRGLLRRAPEADGVQLFVTDEGKRLVDIAWPIHAAGVRDNLLALLSEDDLGRYRALFSLVLEEPSPDTPSEEYR